MDVIETLKAHKTEIKKKLGVKRIGMFGSYARDEHQENSDIDLIVEFDLTRFGEDFGGVHPTS